MLKQMNTDKRGWAHVAFGDVVEKVSNSGIPDAEGSRIYIGLEHMSTDSYRISTWGSDVDIVVSKTRIKKGDVLFARRNTHLRRCAVAPFDTFFSLDGYAFRAKSEKLSQEYLLFLVASTAFMDFAVANSAGTHSKRVKWTDLQRFEFLLPPIQEQARLVEVFTASHNAVETLIDARSKLGQLETSSLLAKFGAQYGKNPEGYELRPLAEFAEIRTGLAKGKPSGSATIELPYLRVANVKDGFLDLSEVKEITVGRNRVQRYTLQAGDVLMTEGGDLDKLGRGTVWQAELPLCLHQNHVFAVRANIELLDPWFLAAIARSVYGKSYFRKCAKRSSNLASINKTQVSSFLVPATPIGEQKNWLQAYHQIRREGDRISNRIDELRTINKLLLEAGFADVV